VTGPSIEDATHGTTTHLDAPAGADPSSLRHRRLIALLAGSLAVIATTLVVIEAATGHLGARAEAAVARLTADVNTRLIVSAAPIDLTLARSQGASILSAEGASRALVSSQRADPAGEAMARADGDAWQRLVTIALEMGRVPDATGPLDVYARSTLASTTDEIAALVEDRNRQRELADAASERGSAAVWGLSLAALAGVLAGLVTVVGTGRSRGGLLVLAYVMAGGAIVMGAVAAGLVPRS
jgi:hypothetical protein